MLAIAFGLVLLVMGAELLVRGGSRLAVAAGVPPLVIGLTVVAYGTSMPEMAVSVIASLRAEPDLALGNVVGSNIFNVLLILGLSAAIAPLAVSKQLIQVDVPVMIAASVVLAVMALNGTIGRIEAAFLVAGAICYTLFLMRKGRRDMAAELACDDAPRDVRRPGRMLTSITMVAGGLMLLVFGSSQLVTGASEVARQLGVSELVIGLTIVAAGTSLPELATSLVAAIRGERDIAVGNIIGSNIFNILAILGVSGVVSERGIAVSNGALTHDLPVMVGVALVCVPIFMTGGRISRLEGVLLVLGYACYLAFLFSWALDGVAAGSLAGG